MQRERQRAPRVLPGLALTAAALCAACFIDSGDCVSQGVVIRPCAVPMKVGQTRVFSATVTADPNDQVNWVQTDALDAGFDPTVGLDGIELIGTGVPGVYKLRAESATDPARFGESIITVVGNSYGYPPPPVQVNGTDEPVGYESAVAAGGNRYYMAYANPVVLRGPVDNFFVKQFDLASNVERETISGQFTLFGSRDPNGVAPNIVADCKGNGYWLDRVDQSSPVVLRRLTAGGAFDEFAFSGHFLFGMLAVDCDGAIYFDGGDSEESHVGIFRIPAFGEEPVPFPITGFGDVSNVYETLVIDLEGRLLLADADPELCSSPGAGLPQILRVVPMNGVGEPDATFVPRSPPTEPFIDGIQALAVDGTGVVYVLPITESDCVPLPPREVLYLNSAGLEVDSKQKYVYQCPDSCTEGCGEELDFQNLRSIAVGAQGKLRVIDDVDLCDVKVPDCLPPACLVTVRLILLDP